MMRRGSVLLVVLAIAAIAGTAVPTLVRKARTVHPVSGKSVLTPGPDGNTTVLHNGWRIRPAGSHVACGDLPLGGAVSPDGRLAVVPTCGYNAHAIHLLDLREWREIASWRVPKAWAGAAWKLDGRRLYVSGGLGNPQADIYCYGLGDGETWQARDDITLRDASRTKSCVSAIAMSPNGDLLFALNVADGYVYVVDPTTRETLQRVAVGTHPVACALSSDGRTLYVANWGGAEVACIRLEDGQAPVVKARWAVGAHPNAIAVTPDGRLFVSCGSADTVDILDASDGSRTERVRTSPTPQAPLGSTPNALAIAGGRLYVANADNNSVCVVDVARRGQSRVLGFIPTGWYPSAVLASGSTLVIGSGKGTGTRPNPARLPLNPIVPTGFDYIGRQLNGLLSFVRTPSDRELSQYTRQVVACTPFRQDRVSAVASTRRTAIPTRVGQASPIRYVLYIIKENRTYDQVFGDLPQGNGDPALCLFGRDVTPNQHALAEQFVLLDNLYCSGEVSQDGHPWSTMAYATDYTQRAWVLGYSGKGNLPDLASMADSPAGFIWQACKARSVSYRSYGEYAGHPSLEGNHSLAYIGKAGPGSAPPGRDTDRADIFIREFREFERAGTMPRFTVMSLGENHTNGTRAGSFTPKAMVASNDVAVGRIVEAVTHSSLWKQFAIFIIEDDAQNGPDHVDAHRTAGLVISPYTRRRYVDSTMYSTASMLRTMELILGLPPLTQHDAAATPMLNSFTDEADLSAFTALPARTDLQAKNPATAYGAARSARMDWSEYDRIDEDALNRILWHSIKGARTPYPGAVRSALIRGG